MKKYNTWNIKCLVDELFVPVNYHEDYRHYNGRLCRLETPQVDISKPFFLEKADTFKNGN